MGWMIQNKVNDVWGNSDKPQIFDNFLEAYETWRNLHKRYGYYRIVKTAQK